MATTHHPGVMRNRLAGGSTMKRPVERWLGQRLSPRMRAGRRGTPPDVSRLAMGRHAVHPHPTPAVQRPLDRRPLVPSAQDIRPSGQGVFRPLHPASAFRTFHCQPPGSGVRRAACEPRTSPRTGRTRQGARPLLRLVKTVGWSGLRRDRGLDYGHGFILFI